MLLSLLNRALRTIVIVVVIWAALDPSTQASADSVNYEHIVNIAGQQRTLSQQMTKEAVLVSMGVDVASNLRNLSASRELFSQTLSGLRLGDASLDLPGTSDAGTMEVLGQVDAIWSRTNELLNSGIAAGRFTDQEIAVLVDLSPLLLAASENVVTAFINEARNGPIFTVLVEAINVSGRERMLSQRMALQFFLVANGHDSAVNRQALRETTADFEVALRALIDGSPELRVIAAPTVDIRLQLAAVDGLWSNEVRPLMESMLAGHPPSPQMVAEVARLNLDLLQEMNRTVELYDML